MHDWQRLLDEARADDLAQARTRERWLRRQATEEATLAGTLLDIAETGASISVTLAGGRRHEGVVVALTPDTAVVAERGDHVAVRLDTIAVVRPHPGAGAVPATGSRVAALDLRFTELLARSVDDRPEVAVSLVTGDSVAGTLLAVGADVLTVRVASGDGGLAYCPSPSVASVRFRSG